MAWTDEQKTEAIEKYEAAEPTAETSAEIVEEIARDMEQTVNGVRMVLVQAGVYIKKDTASKGTSTAKGEGTKRVSKESQIAELTTAINARGAEVDEEILSKLTGKAAAYFVKVLAS